MFQIPQRQYWSCMGETVLKKTEFDKDSAAANANNRQYANQLATQQSQMQQRASMTATPLLNPFNQQQQPLTPIQQFVQSLPQVITRPIQAVLINIQNAMQQLAQALPQPLQQLPGFIDKAVGQILSFFFGYKKDKTEEKEKRDRNDATLKGMFGDTDMFEGDKVDKKENAGTGTGGQQ